MTDVEPRAGDVQAATSERPPVTHRVEDGSAVDYADAQVLWAAAARERLITTAGTYHALTTVKQLADEVQADTGVRTSKLMMNWMGLVLDRVAADCVERGEPLLSSLCVNREGAVGASYTATVQALRGDSAKDPDDDAAAERLECYRFFGATIPADGGRPALSPAMKVRRDRAMAARPERRGAVCPSCFVEVPVSGRCPTCG